MGDYYTTQALRGPITKINQSKCSIAGPIFSEYWTGIVPNDPAPSKQHPGPSKQHEELTRYVILFVLHNKTESIFHLP